MKNKDGFFKTGKVSAKVVMILLILFLVVTGVITTFAQKLSSDALEAKTNNSDWDISFTKVVQDKITGSAKEIKEVSYTNTSATFYVKLSGVGDSISYDFTVTNNGILDAKVESIYIVPANKEDDALLFYTSNLNKGDEIKAGDSKNLKVSVNFNNNYKGDTLNLEKNVQIWVNFVQA